MLAEHWKSVSAVALLFMVTTHGVSQEYRQWDSPDLNGIPVRQGTHLEYEGSVARDPYGNFCLVWSDASNGDRNIYAQLYNSAAEPLWNDDGITLISADYYFINVQACRSGDGFFIVWEDAANGYDNLDLLGQFINDGGEMLWAADGVPLALTENSQRN